MYGKTLSIPDESLPDWYSLLLDSAPDPALGAAGRQAGARAGAGGAVPRRPALPRPPQDAFDRVHVRHELPEEMPEVVVRCPGRRRPPAGAARPGVRDLDLGGAAQPRPGGGQARRRADRRRAARRPAARVDGAVLQLGKRRFARVRLIAELGPELRAAPRAGLRGCRSGLAALHAGARVPIVRWRPSSFRRECQPNAC